MILLSGLLLGPDTRSAVLRKFAYVAGSLAVIVGATLVAPTGAAPGGLAPDGDNQYRKETPSAQTTPVLTSAIPAPSGTTAVGQTLTAQTGSWSGSHIVYSFQWQRCDASGTACAAIAGATAQTFLLGSGDAGRTLRVLVTATNPQGSASGTSAATAVIADVVSQAAAPAPSPSPSPPPSPCTYFASPSGSDSNPGTETAPFRTVTYLLAQLEAGQTGCLKSGTYVENVSIRSGGKPGFPLTLRSAPGERATIAGIFYVADSANDVVVSDLVLNGKNATATPSVQINGDRVVLRGNEITNENTAICVILGGGWTSWGRARDVVVDGNRIHNCGRLPATNHDHGIYVEGADNARIVNNYVYDNADWGVHLYPAAMNTVVERNVIDGNGKGVIFAGDGSLSSNGNVVRYNIISNSTIRYNVEAWWGGSVGRDNLVDHNCLWNGRMGNIDSSAGGFAVGQNTIADPLYVDRAAKDFRLRPGSPCAGAGPQ